MVPEPRRQLLLFLVVVVLALGSCASGGTAHPVGFISVRNESMPAVRVEIDRPNGWPWSLAGPDRQVVWVPQWRSGLCPAATIGLSDVGTADTLPESQIVVSGPSIPEPTTFPGVATRIQTGGLVLTVDAAGAIRVEQVEPTLWPGCESYPLGTAPEHIFRSQP